MNSSEQPLPSPHSTHPHTTLHENRLPVRAASSLSRSHRPSDTARAVVAAVAAVAMVAVVATSVMEVPLAIVAMVAMVATVLLMALPTMPPMGQQTGLQRAQQMELLSVLTTVSY